MNTLVKIIISTIFGISLSSCQFSFRPGISGNGIIETQERTLNSDFNAIDVNRGLDVYITQGDENSITIQADENLIDLITTEIENGVLTISTTDNIKNAASKKVLLNFKNLNSIKANSGSDLLSTHQLNFNDLNLEATSGADINLELIAEQVICYSSSGSDIKLKGKSNTLKVNSSSGSDINAKDLKSNIVNANASSGSDIIIHASKKLNADANSGADIIYYGNPEEVSKSDGASGSIVKR